MEPEVVFEQEGEYEVGEVSVVVAASNSQVVEVVQVVSAVAELLPVENKTSKLPVIHFRALKQYTSTHLNDIELLTACQIHH